MNQHDSHRNPGRAHAEARARAEAMIWGRSEVNHGDSPYKALADLCAEERLEQARDAITDLLHYVDHLLHTEADLDGEDLVDTLEQAHSRYDEEIRGEGEAEQPTADPHPDLLFSVQLRVHGQERTILATAAALNADVPGWRSMLPADDEFHAAAPEVDRAKLTAYADAVAMTSGVEILAIE